MFGIGGSKSIVGLDIGSSSIKAVELKKSRGEVEVVHVGLEPLASDIVVDSMIVDSGSVSSAITKIFNENNIKSKSVATSVSGHSVIVKRIPVQAMDDSTLADQIGQEAAQHIPFDVADVNVDYRAAGGSEERQDPELHQRVVAGRQDSVCGRY
ncbi:MAG: hypothetical protein DMG67_06300 [Acidobacteria bacterium]|nr:MAG: hypothetical protein DMG67_06300 [Acidobacteriota bacterium]